MNRSASGEASGPSTRLDGFDPHTVRHQWQVLASKYGIQRARCKSCPCFRTITKGSENLPVTRYELGGKTFLKAPECGSQNDKTPHEVGLDGYTG